MEKFAKIDRIPLTVFALICANDLIDTAAQLLMKKGLSAEPFLFVIGLALYVSNFFLWMYILSRTDLSVALPLASVSYVLIPLASIFWLHEHVPSLRWLGLAFIILGINFISRSKPSRSRT